jgi:hypothetical protein
MTGVVVLLGIVSGDAETPPATPPHRRVRFGGGCDALVVDRTAAEADDPHAAALSLALTQAAVLSAYAGRFDVLPMALGAAFSDDGALSAGLRAAGPSLRAAREALVGSAEYVVAVDDGGPLPEGQPPPETGYLRRRQADRDARRHLVEARRSFVDRILRALDTTCSRVAPPRTPVRGGGLTISALVPRASAADATAALEALEPEAARLGLGLRLIGPCAPFSFVSTEPLHG